MDTRVFNASVAAGLALVFGGVGMQFSWPVACIVLGVTLIGGTFTAAKLARTRGE